MPTEEDSTTENSKKTIKKQSQRLHPLKYNILNNPFFKYSDEKNTIENVKRLVNLDIMLTTVSTVLMVLLVALIVRLPSLPSTTTTQVPTLLPETVVPTTGTNTVSGNDGKVYEDARDNNDGEFTKTDEKAIPTISYINESMGFEVKYPDDWKLTESQSNGVTTTKITDESAEFPTYIEFTNIKPDLTLYEETGTPNVRDIYGLKAIYRAEGFVKFGRATFAAIPVKSGSFYINYMGNVENDILPVLATFATK